MAKAETKFGDLAGLLELALVNVRSAKESSDFAENAATTARNTYQTAIKSAQKAKADYDAHVNEAMSGFAQLHQ